MIKKVKSELVPLTREIAQKFASMQALPGERTFNPDRAKFYQDHLKGQTFNSPTWSQAFVAGTKHPWRGDGQHTSFVLANSPDSLFPVELKVTIHTYELDSFSEAPAFFDLFDNPKAARSNVDKMGTYTASYPDLATIDRVFLAKVARGIDFYLRDLSKESGQSVKTYPTREHGLYFDEEHHRQFAIWLSQWRDNKRGGWMLSKAGLTAEMFADRKSHPELAQLFWDQVINENMGNYILDYLAN